METVLKFNVRQRTTSKRMNFYTSRKDNRITDNILPFSSAIRSPSIKASTSHILLQSDVLHYHLLSTLMCTDNIHAAYNFRKHPANTETGSTSGK